MLTRFSERIFNPMRFTVSILIHYLDLGYLFHMVASYNSRQEHNPKTSWPYAAIAVCIFQQAWQAFVSEGVILEMARVKCVGLCVRFVTYSKTHTTLPSWYLPPFEGSYYTPPWYFPQFHIPPGIFQREIFP